MYINIIYVAFLKSGSFGDSDNNHRYGQLLPLLLKCRGYGECTYTAHFYRCGVEFSI